MTEQSQHDAGAHIISHCKVDDAPAAGVVPLANGEELQQQSGEHLVITSTAWLVC